MRSLFIALISILSVPAFAAETAINQSKAIQTSTFEAALPTGLVPFLGFGTGYTANSSISPVEGTPTSMKLLGSYYFPTFPIVADLGFGLNNSIFSHSVAPQQSAAGSVFEVAGRYNFPQRIQAGLVFNDLVNQGGAYSASQGDAQFLGLQALKEFNIGDQWLARGGVRAMTETNNTGASVNMFLIELQIGWNYSARRASASEVATAAAVQKTPATAIDRREPATALAPVPAASLLLKDRIKSSNKLALFAPSAATISATDKAYLKKLAAVLKANRQLYSQVKVHGFADISGTEAMNQKLSLHRAQAVRSTIASNSKLGRSNILAVGESDHTGSTHVVSTDRRVDIEFIGVKDEAKLRKAISTIQ